MALLFVYGTLTRAAAHPMGDLLRAKGRPLGTGTITARLYIVADPDLPEQPLYPGAVASDDPRDRVFGEIHAVPELLFRDLDTYERCTDAWPDPHEYRRTTVDVLTLGGHVLPAQTYLYRWDVSRALHLPTGRFTDWRGPWPPSTG